MTAFGRASECINGKEITLEIKSVNNRFADYAVRVPRTHAFLEEKIKAYLQMRGISRGKIEVNCTVNVLESAGTDIHLDAAYAESYLRALRELRDRFCLTDDISVMSVAANRDLFVAKKPESDADEDWCDVLLPLEHAADAFCAAREAEGGRIEADLRGKLEQLRTMAKTVEEHAEDATRAYRQRLETKLRQALEEHGVQFHFGVQVVNVEFDCKPERKQATRIDVIREGEADTIDLTENDLVFITNGGCVENSSMGSQNEPAQYNTELKPGGGWDMWRKIAAQDPSFGHPDKFCHDPEQTNWMSATVETLDQKIIPYIKNICKRDPFTGKVVTGGIVTVKDSSWLMSWTINRQPQFRAQPKDHCLVWVYSLFTDKPGDYVKKPMRDCTGKEICMEWLYHIGVPEDQIEELATNSANTVPVMMPYIDAFFMPRAYGDRPKVVPDGSVNFAFLGQFAETPRDTIFTTEYSMRTGMEAVYTLLNVDRGVPEVWGSVYDVRDLLNATVKLRDGKPITDMKLNLAEKVVLKKALEKIGGTDIEKLLKEYHVI